MRTATVTERWVSVDFGSLFSNPSLDSGGWDHTFETSEWDGSLEKLRRSFALLLNVWRRGNHKQQKHGIQVVVPGRVYKSSDYYYTILSKEEWEAVIDPHP